MLQNSLNLCKEAVFEGWGPAEQGGANKTLGVSHSKQIILLKSPIWYYSNKLHFSLIPISELTKIIFYSVLE